MNKQQIKNIIWDVLNELQPIITCHVVDALITRGALTIAPFTEADIEAMSEKEEKKFIPNP